MFNKEDIANTNLLNIWSGTSHRTKPYDLNNADDLKHALTMAVAAYRDYSHYHFTLYDIEEKFDESVEHFDTASWINMTQNPDKVDDLIVNCVSSLRETSEWFCKLAERAEKHCAFILNAVLSTPPDTQKAVLGQSYSIPAEETDDKIEELFEALNELPHMHPIGDNFDALIACMKECWAAFAGT